MCVCGMALNYILAIITDSFTKKRFYHQEADYFCFLNVHAVYNKTLDLSTKSPAVAEVQPGSTHVHYCAVGRISCIVYVIDYCVAGCCR